MHIYYIIKITDKHTVYKIICKNKESRFIRKMAIQEILCEKMRGIAWDREIWNSMNKDKIKRNKDPVKTLYFAIVRQNERNGANLFQFQHTLMNRCN